MRLRHASNGLIKYICWQVDSDDEREAAAAKIALGHKMEAQRKKKIKNKARLPRTAGLRTLTDLTTDLTKAGIDPSRVQERAVMIAKMRGAGHKRKRDEDGMDVDGDDEDGDNWVSEGDGEDETMMDVDGDEGEEDGTGHKRGKANSGAIIGLRKRTPRSNRQLAGMRDEAVRCCYAQHHPLSSRPSFPFSKGADEISSFFPVANIQGDAITESWTARAQHACESRRERPRYQSQNGAFAFSYFKNFIRVLLSLAGHGVGVLTFFFFFVSSSTPT
jgi:nucleolar GTP-binding protein